MKMILLLTALSGYGDRVILNNDLGYYSCDETLVMKFDEIDSRFHGCEIIEVDVEDNTYRYLHPYRDKEKNTKKKEIEA